MTTDLYNYHRRATYNVHVGRTPLGSNYPVRLQSMTTTSTDDIEGSVEQVKRIVRAGADYVRLTTQGLREVESLREIHVRASTRATMSTRPANASTSTIPTSSTPPSSGGWRSDSRSCWTSAASTAPRCASG